jgi:pilus assembly protein CpaC
VGKSALVDFNGPVVRIAVGLGEFAEATAVSRTEVMVNGKQPGTTSLIVWQSNGQRTFFNVNVHASRAVAEDSLAAIRRQLKIGLPNQDVSIAAENNLVFLRGTVNDLASSDRAMQIASAAGKVVNLLYVTVPAAPRQVLLKVRFASVDRNRSRQLGLNIYSLGATNSLGTVSTGQFSPPTVSSPTGGAAGALATITNPLNISIFRPDLNLGATLQALAQKGVVEVLAEPNVLAEDGKQASFLAGGQYPYPIVQGTSGGNTVTIQFKEFGVRLGFIPTITPRGTIRLQVAPEVSSLDFTNAVTLSGFTVPAINIRRVNTEVELSSGQSFAIGGLLDNRDTRNYSKIPFIGDVPIIGKLFQSENMVRNNTELIVIITPELVTPAPGGTIAGPNYPNSFLPANSNTPMSTPVPAGNQPADQPKAVPVEELIQSNKPEKPLMLEGYGSVNGGSSVGGTALPQ